MAFGRMKTLAAFLFFALVSTTSLAGTESMHLIQPKGSTLKVVVVQRGTDLSARFSGRTWVHGTFVARWPNGAANKNYDSPDYLLIPDHASIARLPYFYLREPPYFNRYRVREIEIENGAEALLIVAGQQRARKLLDRKKDRVEVVGAFLISGYSVGVECDASWARAKLEKANIPSKTASLPIQVPESC